jgi:magnesium transporter
MDIDDKHLFILLKIISWDSNSKSIKFEQVSFLLSDNCLISFQEMKGDVFDKVRQRIRNKNSRIRRLGVDYLLYSLLDAIIDNYFLLLFNLCEEIERMEDSLVHSPDNDILAAIYSTKRDILALRKSIWHLRPVITNLYRDEFKIITPEVSRFLKDLQDNTSQVIDTIETYRENISGLVDMHLSNTNNRMNQIMKVLTIFAAIFIPLTFVAGVYGMNFEYMPELSQKWAYPAWWLVSIIITASMLIFFKKKKWL